MGDILGAVFGTSSTTSQTTQPDAIGSAMNFEKLKELVNLFSVGSLNQFAGAEPGIYSPTDETRQLIQRAGEIANQPLDYSNMMSLEDYKRSFDAVDRSYESAATGLNNATGNSINALNDDYIRMRDQTSSATQGALARSYGDYNIGANTAQSAYGQGTGDINAAYNAAIQRGDYDLARAITSANNYANTALQGNYANTRGVMDTNAANAADVLSLSGLNANRNLNENYRNYLHSRDIAEYEANRSLSTQDVNRARALELGLGTTGNYVDQIARPRLEQVMALQGLERGAALPAAIARATAEHAMPYLQSIENVYGTNQANTLNSLMQLQGALSGDYTGLQSNVLSNLTGLQGDVGKQLLALQSGVGSQYMGTQADVYANLTAQQAAAQNAAQAGNVALGGQRLGAQANLASGYQNNIAQLAQALMANNVSLEQAGIAANSALGQQLIQAQTALRTQQQEGITSLANAYGTNKSNFVQSLPGASAQLTMLPVQARAGQAAIVSSLAPLADFSRQLRENDFLRRQGLFTTAYTGIPYTPGGTVTGGSATGNIFDQLSGTIGSAAAPGGNINR